MKNKIILGIDPGYERLGWGVIESCGNRVRLLDAGVIRTHKSEEFPTRLAIIHAELTSVICKHKPTDVAIEDLFFAKNTKTALKVSAARGVIFLCAVHHCGTIHEYKPNQVKLSTTGVGNADKTQVQEMVKRILGLPEVLKPDDIADAVAIAITHAAHSRS
ncbi:MAG: crossover junction endodeoxyribonuclease RuvC [Firmicutes bacterium]|nr:crossover junction endodeoxyribonuclease RuvC [Bacillota bacterium]